MNPDETVQKLLNQDKRFNREVRIVRDNRFNQNANLEVKPPSVQSSTPRNEPVISNTSEKRYSYMDGMFLDKRFNREVRIVRDNRFNQNANLEVKPPSVQSSTPRNEPVISNTSEKRCYRHMWLGSCSCLWGRRMLKMS
ncbi:unnamed protein product [Ilex paraguariensis]|uniref:Uncharacterized protein n=1 Tax=Ilex paraguariensis TaxID=185542 RepID=A0ABC8UFY0_9AQUA